MGKPTGFLEFTRKNEKAQTPLERIRHFQEFHFPLSREERQEQGARCMECGVPFCQSGTMLEGMVSGCPLHNLIPEWNDLIYTGNFDRALERLLKTNSFPEFTGRVCPALCEAACTCGLYGDPVTVKANEMGVIEEAFSCGLMAPKPPKTRTGKKVAVVGSGPAGLATAVRLNSRGHSVTIFERADRPGGLLMYGIPNMKLEKSVVERRISLMRDEGIEFVLNADVGQGFSVEDLRRDFDAVVLCVGAGKPRDLPVPGRDSADARFAVEYLSESTKSLLDGQPSQTAKGRDVVVVGGGDTGNDCVGTAIRQGCRSVVQLEMMPSLPESRAENNPWPQWPRVKKTDYGQEEAIALFGSDPRRYQTTVKEIFADGNGAVRAVVTVALKAGREESTGRTVMTEIPGSEEELPCQLLLIAAGFTGPQSYVAQAFNLDTDSRGNLKTDNYSTSAPGIFAAGDARRGQSLVVWAIREGQECARAVDQFLMGYTNL